MRKIALIAQIVSGASFVIGLIADIISIDSLSGGITLSWGCVIIISGIGLSTLFYLIMNYYNTVQNRKKTGRLERVRSSEGKLLARTVAIPDIRYGYYVSFCCKIDMIDDIIGYGSVHNIITTGKDRDMYMDIEVHVMLEEHKEMWKRISGNDKLVLEQSFIIPSVSREIVQ